MRLANATSHPLKNTLLEIDGYQGEIAIGPYQFYQSPRKMRMKHAGQNPVDILVWGSSWYGTKPEPQLGPAARLHALGNDFHGTGPAAEPAIERMFFMGEPSEPALEKLSRALDDLRRLGELDLRLNHPQVR